MFYALLTAGIKIPEPDKIAMIKNFVPCINNWAVCDIFCGDLKEVGKNPAPFYQEFKTYLHSAREYEIRFFYVLALMYFLTPEYLPELLSAVSSQVFVGFYDKMAAAWFLSVAYVKFPDWCRTKPLADFTVRPHRIWRFSLSGILSICRTAAFNQP